MKLKTQFPLTDSEIKNFKTEDYIGKPFYDRTGENHNHIPRGKITDAYLSSRGDVEVVIELNEEFELSIKNDKAIRFSIE